MSDRLSRVEERLRQIDDAVACLSRRLDRLEHGLGADDAFGPGVRLADGGSVRLQGASQSDGVMLLSLAGRTCLVFGGAYLLRALTESGHLPATTGVLLGLLYAVGWLAAADRASSPSALFHGFATVLIGLPIVWEAAGRFRFLSPGQGAAALAAVVALALAVAWHRRLPALAATIVLGALATSTALMVALDRVVPFAALLVGSAGAALWVAYHRRWTWLAVLTGVVANVAVLAALMRAVAIPPREAMAAVLALHVVLIAIYFGSFVARTLQRLPLGLFEYAQGSIVLLVGLGGAVALVRSNQIAIVAIGTAACVAAGLAYWMAFGPIRRRLADARTLHFFTSLGFVLALVAGRLLLADAAYAIVLAAGALAAVGVGRWTRSAALMVQGVLALIAAFTFSGALSLIVQVWLGSPTEWPILTIGAWAVIAATLACFTLQASPVRDGSPRAVTIARVTCAALTVVGLGTTVVLWIGPLLIGTTPAAGSTATVKSLVLAVSAVFLAWTRSVAGLSELSRLTYPLLIAGGLKILAEDLPLSRPATLVAALAAYGAALILAPRLLRSRRGPDLPPSKPAVAGS